MDRREVYGILNVFLEKCENLEQDLHSAFKETEDWTESLRNDVKRLLNKETEGGFIIPKTPAASRRLRRVRLSVINESDDGDNGEHSKPTNKEPTNQLVLSSVSQESVLLSSNKVNEETISENEGKEVQRNRRKKTSTKQSYSHGDELYEESSSTRSSSRIKRKSKRATRKSHSVKISQDGMKLLHSSCSEGSIKFSSSGCENDLPNEVKNDTEMQEQDKILKESLAKEGNIDLQKQLCSKNHHVPSSSTEDCKKRGTFIKNSSTNQCEGGTKFENVPNNERDVVSLDHSVRVDTTDVSVSNSPLINNKKIVKERESSSKLKDSSTKRETRSTNSKLINLPSSGTKVTYEVCDVTFGDKHIEMKQHETKMKSPERQGLKEQKRSIVENDKSENTKNGDVERNSEIQKNCVVVLYDCINVSMNTNEKDKNVPEDKPYSEKGDSNENGTNLCDLSASNLNLTSHSIEENEKRPTPLSHIEVESFSKTQCSSGESGFVSPSDNQKVKKAIMGILKDKEMIKTGKRITRSKARALGGLEKNGVPAFHMKTINYKKDNTVVQKCARTSIKKAIKTLASNQKHLDSKENSVVYQSKKLVNHTPFSSKVLSDVNVSSSSLLNTSKKTPLNGPLLHFGSANKLIKSTAKPGVVLTNIATFIKKKAVVSENKEEELKKKQEKENEAQRRREELLRKKIEDQKKKKEEQRLKVLQKREALEKEKQQLQERVEKDREVKQKDNILKKKLELERKAGIKRKNEEAETARAKRKQEELQVKALNDVLEESSKHCEEEKKAISEKIVNKKLTVLLKTENNLQKNAPEVCNLNTTWTEPTSVGLNTTWTEPTSADLNTTWVKPVVPSVSKPVNSAVNEAGNNAYFLDDLMSEDSGEEDDNQSQKKPARWAKRRSKLLHESLLEMHLAPKIKRILTCNQPIRISEMFPNKRLLRTSSAKWDTPPRYSTLPQY